MSGPGHSRTRTCWTGGSVTDTDTSSLPEDPDDRNSGGFAGWLNELAAAPNEDDLFAILASQRPPTSQLGRQQIRGRLVKVLGKRFKELDSGVSAPRTADAWLQEGGDEGDSLQGQVFVAEEIAPWGSAIRGADVLDEVFGVFDAYLYGSEENLVALTVWAAYSHVFDCFGVSPILDLTSPTKRCGKSSAVVVLRQICRSALLSGNITSAALFRAVEAWKPTLLIDEADTFAKMNDGLRGILNAGHTRDTAFVIRAEGDANEPRLFSTWAPKVVAAIGHLPDTIEDRAVRIELTRKPTYIVKRDAFDPEGVRADCADVRRKLARFALDELDLIAATKFERPAGLHDRAWNNLASSARHRCHRWRRVRAHRLRRPRRPIHADAERGEESQSRTSRVWAAAHQKRRAAVHRDPLSRSLRRDPERHGSGLGAVSRARHLRDLLDRHRRVEALDTRRRRRLRRGRVPGPAVTADEERALHERAVAWVETTCAEQGVPVKLSDPVALQRIADILGEARDAREKGARKGTRAA